MRFRAARWRTWPLQDSRVSTRRGAKLLLERRWDTERLSCPASLGRIIKSQLDNDSLTQCGSHASVQTRAAGWFEAASAGCVTVIKHTILYDVNRAVKRKVFSTQGVFLFAAQCCDRCFRFKESFNISTQIPTISWLFSENVGFFLPKVYPHHNSSHIL